MNDLITKYLADLWHRYKKGIISEKEYDLKVDTCVEINLFEKGNRQLEKNGLWEEVK